MQRIEYMSKVKKKQTLPSCPFCGENDQFGTYNPIMSIAFIKCPGCGAVVSFEGNESMYNTIIQYKKIERTLH